MVRYFTGALELSGAIGLLIPKVTNLTVLHLPVMARVTAILLALALVLAWLRRAEGHLPSVKFE
jgi:uncharacterized membrane protein